jgi:hypothetical protein
MYSGSRLLICMQAYNVIAAVVNQRAEPGVTIASRVLEVRDTDVSLSLPST